MGHTDLDLDALADAVARKLAPRLTVPIRLTRKAMAQALGISPRLLQAMTNREHDPCPCDHLNTIPLYHPKLVDEWCSRQKKTAGSAPAAGGKE